MHILFQSLKCYQDPIFCETFHLRFVLDIFLGFDNFWILFQFHFFIALYGCFHCLHRGWLAALKFSLSHFCLISCNFLVSQHSFISFSAHLLHSNFGLSLPLTPSTSNAVTHFTQLQSCFLSTCTSHPNNASLCLQALA